LSYTTLREVTAVATRRHPTWRS